MKQGTDINKTVSEKICRSLRDLTITIYADPALLHNIEKFQICLDTFSCLRRLRATFADIRPPTSDPKDVSMRLFQLLPSMARLNLDTFILNLHSAPMVDLLRARWDDRFDDSEDDDSKDDERKDGDSVDDDSEDDERKDDDSKYDGDAMVLEARARSDKCISGMLMELAAKLTGFGMYIDRHTDESLLTMLTGLSTLSLHAGDGWGHFYGFPKLQKALEQAFEAFHVLTDLTLVGIWTEYYPDSLERLSLQKGLLSGDDDEDDDPEETPKGWEAFLRLERLQSLVLDRPAWSRILFKPVLPSKPHKQRQPDLTGNPNLPRIACPMLRSMVLNLNAIGTYGCAVLNKLFMEYPDIKWIEMYGEFTSSMLADPFRSFRLPLNLVGLFIELPEANPLDDGDSVQFYSYDQCVLLPFGDVVKPLHADLYPRFKKLVVNHIALKKLYS